MNWDAVGAIGEIIGAGAVVASLVYLAFQIKTQNREARLSATHEISVGFRDAVRPMMSEDMSTIFVKANTDYDSLTDIEAQRLLMGMGQLFRTWEEAFIQHQEGRLDERSWEAILKYYSMILGAPATRKGWTLRKDYLDDQFVAFVDSQPLEKFMIR